MSESWTAQTTSLEPEPALERVVKREEVRPGDVLLHRDNSATARLIRLLDGAVVHHASIALSRDRVGESLGRTGVVERGFEESHYGRELVLVRRYNGTQEGSAPSSILACARGLLQQRHRYAYEQIPFLALLCLSRRAPWTRSFVPMVARILDAAVRQLRGWEAHTDRATTPMVCSGFVYECFARAEPPMTHALRIGRWQETAERLSPRDIDPDSLLAGAGGLLDEWRWSRNLGRDREEVGAEAWETWIEAYLVEVAQGEVLPALRRADLESAGEPGLEDAILRFARALHASSPAAPPLESAPLEADAHGLLEVLKRIAGNLVTPGDLLQTQSLATQGRLDIDDGPLTVREADSRPNWHDDPEMPQLEGAIRNGDRSTAERLCSHLTTRVLRSEQQLPPDLASNLLGALQRRGYFDLMRKLGDAFLRSGQVNLRLRRQYAQALIEDGDSTAALHVLEALLEASAGDPAEQAEIQGLVGRVHKQRYVAGEAPSRAAETLRSAIRAYYEIYASQPHVHLSHGINAAALLVRAEHDGLTFDLASNGGRAPDPRAIADEVLQTVRSRARKDLGPGDLLTAAEASLVLGRMGEALSWLNAYLDPQSETGGFELASTLRQLKEVWGLTDDGPGAALVSAVKAALLRRSGAHLDLAIGELQSSREGLAGSRASFEKVFGRDGPLTIDWYGRGLDRARAVGRVEKADSGRGIGSGFLVRASDFFEGVRSGELIFLTNSHVLGYSDAEALRPESAAIRFEALGSGRRTFRVGELLWESPPGDLDATLLRLDSAISDVEAIPLAGNDEPVFIPSHPRRLYMIGYPLGGPLSVSIHDNEQVGWRRPRVHYRTPAQPGSSGSPVFDAEWRLLAVHRAGSQRMPRLDDPTLSYQANEGIWVHALAERTRLVKPPGAPSPYRPLEREGILVAHGSRDQQWVQELRAALTAFTPAPGLAAWGDCAVAADAENLRELEKGLERTRVAVLLASEGTVFQDEVLQILRSSQRDGLVVFWIPVGPGYDRARLAGFKSASDPGHPVATLTAADRDEAWTEIARAIHDAAAGRTTRIFISYSQADRPAARKVADALAAAGLSFWRDERWLTAGDDFAAEITRAIRESAAFLVLLSEASNSSDSVSKEVAIAHHFQRRIIPVRLDKAVLADTLLPYLVRLHSWDLREHGAPELAAHLAGALGLALTEAGVVPSETAAADELPAITEPVRLVTVGEYRSFARSALPNGGADWLLVEPDAAEDLPVTRVGWDQAMAYCDWMGGRLPGLEVQGAAPAEASAIAEWRDAGTEWHKHVRDPRTSALLAALGRDARPPKVGFRCLPVELAPPQKWVAVAEGPCQLGTNIARFTELANLHHLPLALRQPVVDRKAARYELGGFVISATCVTNEEYYAFTRATGKPWPPYWSARWLARSQCPFPARLKAQPVVAIEAEQAQAYCIWSGTRLPTALEWERAAAGPEGRQYPWGNEYSAARCNSVESESGSLDAVHEHASGDTPEGIRQLCGNVAEWVIGRGAFELRGGSYRMPCEFWGLSYAFRQVGFGFHLPDVGFRVCHR